MNAVTQTIINQLGGRRFQAMTGCEFITNDEKNTVIIKFKMSRRINIVEVVYDAGLDMYNVFFRKNRAGVVTTITVAYGLFADQLVDAFEATTGLYARL